MKLTPLALSALLVLSGAAVVTGAGAAPAAAAPTPEPCATLPSTGHVQTDVATGLRDPSGLAIDDAGVLYVGEVSGGRVQKLTRSGDGWTKTQLHERGSNGPHGVAVDHTGAVWVTEGGNGFLNRFRLEGTSYELDEAIAWGLGGVTGVAVDSAGMPFATSRYDGIVYALAPNPGNWSRTAIRTAPAGTETYGVAVDASGAVYSTDVLAGSGEVVRSVRSGGTWTHTALPSTGLGVLRGIAVSDDGTVYVVDQTDRRVVSLTPTSGGGYEQAVVSTTGLANPLGIAVGDDGTVYVADSGTDKVVGLVPISVRADADSASTTAGAPVTTTVLGNDDATGPTGTELADPTIAVHPANGTATVNADGTITYTPADGFSGTDTYRYAVRDAGDPASVCATATVTVTVGQDNSCGTTGTSGGKARTLVPTGIDYPNDLVLDTDGDLLVLDSDTGEVVAFTPTGDGFSRSVAVSGLAGPVGIAVDDAGVLYVTSYQDSNVTRLTPSPAGYTRDVIASGGQLDGPAGIAVDADGDLYVVSRPTSMTQGTVVRLVKASGYAQQVVTSDLSFPNHVATDADGTVYVTTSDGVVSFTPAGGGWDRADVLTGGHQSYGITVDEAGTLWLGDPYGDGMLTLTRSDAGWDRTRVDVWGDSSPQAIAVRGDGVVFATDGFEDLAMLGPARLRAVADTATASTPRSVTTDVRANDEANTAVAAPSVVGGPAHGTATVEPDGTITYTPADGFAGTDTYSYEVRDTASPAQVCSVATVTVTVEAENGCALPATGDFFRAPGTTGLVGPTGIAVDARKIIYISDASAQRVIAWYPGSGAARVDGNDDLDPQGVAVDADGNVYYADEGEHEIVRLTWSETEEGYVDRTVLASGLQRPSGIAVDADGDVFFAENSSGQVERLTPSGGGWTKTTIGSGLDRPRGLALDADGNVFVADSTNDRIVRFTPTGTSYRMSVVSTSVDNPTGVAVDPASGTMIIGDTGNKRVLRLVPDGAGYRQETISVWGDHTPTWVASAGNITFVVDRDTAEVVIMGAATVDAVDDPASTTAPDPVTTEVRDNDGIEPEGGALADPTVVSGPEHGTATVEDDGRITYTPEDGFSGTDRYTYAVTDGEDPAVACDTAVVTVAVANVFTPGPGVGTGQNQPVETPLSGIATTEGADLDPTAVSVETDPEHGAISVDATSGAVTYTPDDGYSGDDSYVVQVCDTATPVECAEITVPVTVGANTVTTTDVQETTDVATPVTTDVLAGTTSGTGQDLGGPTVEAAPGHGTTSVGEGGITYTPEDGFSGEDSYGFEVCDTSTPIQVCDTATVTVTVENAFAGAAPVTTEQDTAVTTGLGDITRTTGRPVDPTSVDTVTAPASGAITIDPVTGAVTYTPDTGFHGEDVYVVEVCDTSVPVQCADIEVRVRVGRAAATPTITTNAPARATLQVDRNGRPKVVRLSARVTVSGFRARAAANGRATLYGPVAKVTASSCIRANAVATVEFTTGNGTVTTPSVAVDEPGYYLWVASTTADGQNQAATHACGARGTTTLVHRPGLGRLRFDTGFTGIDPSVRGRQVRPTRIAVPALGMRARIDTVGVRRGAVVIPRRITRGGWVAGSAAPGETVGASVIAGHVSDRRDRPGAFGKLRKARKGQVVKVRRADGTVQRYRITDVRAQPRGKGLAGIPVSTTGPHRLTLVTCTGKVTYRNGRFHYTKNLIVTATPIP